MRLTAAPSAAASATHARASTCRNCGAAVSRNYCPECGQDTSLHPLSVWEFYQEIVSHYVAAEGKLWRTLGLLALQPGRLTVEYLAGRRQRYIVPLRLYLTASFLFFAVAQISGHLAPDKVVIVHGNPAPAASKAASGALPEAGPGAADAGGPADFDNGIVHISGLGDVEAMRAEHFEKCLEPGNTCSATKRLLAPALLRMQDDPQGVLERFAERFRHSLSYAMFLMLPIFALLLALTYRRRHLYYGEHLVFALHVHSFWFLLALVTSLLPDAVSDWLPLGFLAYGFWALHRVYGGRWWVTLLRGTTITATYGLIMGIGAAALSVLLLAT